MPSNLVETVAPLAVMAIIRSCWPATPSSFSQRQENVLPASRDSSSPNDALTTKWLASFGSNAIMLACG